MYNARWKLMYMSAKIEIYVRVHGNLLYVSRLLLPWVNIDN